MPSAGGRGALARSEHVTATDHPPVEGEAPCGGNAQRLSLCAKRRRLDEDAEVALAAGRAVDQRFDPVARAVGGDHHHSATPAPAIAMPFDGFFEAAHAVVGCEGEKVEEAQPLHLTTSGSKARAAA